MFSDRNGAKNHTLWGGMRLFLNQPIYAPSGQETPSDCSFTYTLTPKKKQQRQQIRSTVGHNYLLLRYMSL